MVVVTVLVRGVIMVMMVLVMGVPGCAAALVVLMLRGRGPFRTGVCGDHSSGDGTALSFQEQWSYGTHEGMIRWVVSQYDQAGPMTSCVRLHRGRRSDPTDCVTGVRLA